MIKEAEVHHAYLLGRQAAMEKLAKDQDKKEEDDKSDSKKKDKDPRFEGTKALLEELQKQKDVAALVGLTSQGLLRPEAGTMTVPQLLGNRSLEAKNLYTGTAENAARLLTHENAARLGMLGGTIGGTLLGGGGARSAALSAGGSMLGAMAGGNLGRAAAEAANEFIGRGKDHKDQRLTDQAKGKFVSYGGALGGLGGGLASGNYLT